MTRTKSSLPSTKKILEEVFRLKVKIIDGTVPEPFDCPYCGQEIDSTQTSGPEANWEVVSQPSWGEIDRMNCPYCRKRFELHQRC